MIWYDMITRRVRMKSNGTFEALPIPTYSFMCILVRTAHSPCTCVLESISTVLKSFHVAVAWNPNIGPERHQTKSKPSHMCTHPHSINVHFITSFQSYVVGAARFGRKFRGGGHARSAAEPTGAACRQCRPPGTGVSKLFATSIDWMKLWNVFSKIDWTRIRIKSWLMWRSFLFFFFDKSNRYRFNVSLRLPVQLELWLVHNTLQLVFFHTCNI